MADPASFKVDIASFVEKAKANTKEFAVEFIQDLNAQIIEATPVKTGFLRNSWYADLNGEPVAPGGTGNVATMNVIAGQLKLGDTYNVVNGAAYAMRIEFGFVGVDSLGRHYNQAPHSFVRSTLDRAEAIAGEVAGRIAASET